MAFIYGYRDNVRSSLGSSAMKIMWRTRGKCWDYRFLAMFPGGKNLSLFEEYFPSEEAPKKGVLEGFHFPAANVCRYHVSWTSDLTDHCGRPIQHFIVVETESESGVLLENWYVTLFAKLLPIYDRYYDISLDEGKSMDVAAIDAEIQKVVNDG